MRNINSRKIKENPVKYYIKKMPSHLKLDKERYSRNS